MMKGSVILKIETKFNMGDRVWVLYNNGIEINMYLDTIVEITINDKEEILYFKEKCGDEIREDNLILEKDTNLLLNRILSLQKEIESNDDERSCDKPDDSVFKRISDR